MESRTMLPTHPTTSHFDEPCTMEDIAAAMCPNEPGPPPTERKLESIVNAAMNQFPALGSLIKKVATLFPVETKSVKPNCSPDTSGLVSLPISSPKSDIGISARSSASDSTIFERHNPCNNPSISETTTDEDHLFDNGGLEVEMDPGDLCLGGLMYSNDSTYTLYSLYCSRSSRIAVPLDRLPSESDISSELVDGTPLESVDLADVRFSDLSATEQLEPVSLGDIDIMELSLAMPVARAYLDPDLSGLINTAFALDPEEIASYSSLGSPYLVKAHVRMAEEYRITSMPLAARSPRFVFAPNLVYIRFKLKHGAIHSAGDLVGLKIGEQSNKEIVVDSVIGHGTSSDTGPDCGENTTYQLWTSWLPLASLVMLVGGPVLCLSLFFVWRCWIGLLNAEHARSESRTDPPSMNRDLETHAPTSRIQADPSISPLASGTAHTTGSGPHLQLLSDGKSRMDELEPKQTANSIRTSRSKSLHTKKKRVDIQPLVATRKAPPRPYRGPPVPTITITSPDDTGTAPKVCYYGPQVVPASRNGPSSVGSPAPSGGRKRSNAVGESSRAQAEALVAALPVPASSSVPTPVPESALTSSSAPHPARTRARGANQGHRRKQSSMSAWFEHLIGGNNPSVVIRSADLAKLALVLNSPPSSPESTPPTTPTTGSFVPHPELDEDKSCPTVVAEVSHDGDNLIAY
ncbi:hypothetical protein FRC07_014974 [Ceratobasidium sp. 392]|nr:hypothetical protein FRC07_014974 [Ceratobasidium sp. 392]